MAQKASIRSDLQVTVKQSSVRELHPMAQLFIVITRALFVVKIVCFLAMFCYKHLISMALLI